MKKSLVVTLLVLIGVAVPWAATAQDCQYHNFKIDLKTFAFLDEPIPPYEACWEYTKVVGTLGGHYVNCFMGEVSSTEIFQEEYGWEEGIIANKLFGFFETRRGTLFLREWNWVDSEFGNGTVFEVVIPRRETTLTNGGDGNGEDPDNR